MKNDYEEKYHYVETCNFWFVARRQIIVSIINKFNCSKDVSILDVGCSGGILLDKLIKSGYINTYGIDISKKAISKCRENGHFNVSLQNAITTNFEDKKFDLIIVSDVLEHIEEENSAMQEWNRILKPDGKIIIFVPAFMFLWSNHDVQNQHKRRYTKKAVMSIIKLNKFEIDKISYWNISLFIPVLLVRWFQKIIINKNQKVGDLKVLNPLINKALIFLFSIENLLLNVISYPFGVSVYCIAKKPLK